MIFETIFYTTLILSSVFLVSGLVIIITGRREEHQNGKISITIIVLGNTVSLPYRSSYVLCILGTILMFMVHNLYKNIDESHNEISKIALVSSAFAQGKNSHIAYPKTGWVYFGFEKKYKLWNFSFKKGDLSKLLQNNGVVILKSLKDLNVRSNHFGDFTGTILELFDPEPKIIGKLDINTCIKVTDVKSVGFSKIWVKYNKVTCP